MSRVSKRRGPQHQQIVRRHSQIETTHCSKISPVPQQGKEHSHVKAVDPVPLNTGPPRIPQQPKSHEASPAFTAAVSEYLFCLANPLRIEEPGILPDPETSNPESWTHPESSKDIPGLITSFLRRRGQHPLGPKGLGETSSGVGSSLVRKRRRCFFRNSLGSDAGPLILRDYLHVIHSEALLRFT